LEPDPKLTGTADDCSASVEPLGVELSEGNGIVEPGDVSVVDNNGLAFVLLTGMLAIVVGASEDVLVIVGGITGWEFPVFVADGEMLVELGTSVVEDVSLVVEAGVDGGATGVVGVVTGAAEGPQSIRPSDPTSDCAAVCPSGLTVITWYPARDIPVGIGSVTDRVLGATVGDAGSGVNCTREAGVVAAGNNALVASTR
jgi:hypothetical protein